MIDGLVTRKSVWATNVILILRLKERNIRVGDRPTPDSSSLLSWE